jgi:phosphoribosylanthranilate isomerase
VVRVKICGVTSADDARLAAVCGADAVGVLVGQRHPSTDFVSSNEAAAILAALPPFVTAALVTHEYDPAAVADAIAVVRPNVVQIHSEMPPTDCAELRNRFGGIRIIKSYHVTGPEAVDYGRRYVDAVDGFVLDSLNPATGQVGGTGLTHDWNFSAAIVRRYRLPVMLAGGLTPANVAAAVAVVRPFGVDVNSGVKGAIGGRKDPGKMREFIVRAKSVGERGA